MDQKKTIFIAVIANAGLLVVLFISALTTQDDSREIVAQSQKVNPLFSNDADIALQQTVQTPIVQVPIAIKTLEPSEITHRLPPPEVIPVIAEVKPVIETPVMQVTVKKGDTLDKIAKAYNTTADMIIKLNQLPGSFLKVGQVLKLPETKIATTPPPPKVEKPVVNGPEYYIVKAGDSPWNIAMKHHMKLEELLKLNQLNEEKARKLKPGDRLRTR